MEKMRSSIYLLAFLLPVVGFGQLPSQDFYSFRLNNLFNVNPAYANAQENLTFYVGGLAQLRGVSSNTKTLTAGLYARASKNQGLGGNVITDTRGAFNTTKASLAYAYTTRFNDETRLHFGLSAGVLVSNLSVDRIDGYQYIDPTDPTLDPNYYNRTQFVAGGGLLFQWKALDVSVSLPHVLVTNSDALPYFHGYTQYTFELPHRFKLTPGFAYQHLSAIGSVYSGFLQGTYADKFWLKAGYQSRSVVHAMAGVDIDNIGLAYGYRINNGPFTYIASGSHELVLTVRIGKKGKEMRYNPTLIEIDHRLTKLLNKNVTDENREAIIAEVKEIRQLMEHTEINDSTPEAATEANNYLGSIETKLKQLQEKLYAR